MSRKRVSGMGRLASALQVRHEMNELSFVNVNIIEFSAISLSFEKSQRTYLYFERCEMTPNLMENIRFLLAANARRSLSKTDCRHAEDQPIDLSGAIRSNQSLRNLTLTNEPGSEVEMVVSQETIHDIPFFLRENQDVLYIDLQGISIGSHEVSLIAKAAEGHDSLTYLVLTSLNLEEYAAQPTGNMLMNAPALRQLHLDGCLRGPENLCQLANGLRNDNTALNFLSLLSNQLGDDGAIVLGNILETNQKLKRLGL
jgi:hypothetical protein